MKTFTNSLLLTLAVAAGVAHAASNAYADTAAAISDAATTFSAGDYVFTNVATGQTLSFVRSTVTNVYPNDGGDSLAVQFSGNQARLSGGNDKCVSAQWTTAGRGYDNAAVSYACAVGTGDLSGTATLEKTKQWWYIVPSSATVDASSASSSVVASLVAQEASKYVSTDTTTVYTTSSSTTSVSSSSSSSDDDSDDSDSDDDVASTKGAVLAAVVASSSSTTTTTTAVAQKASSTASATTSASSACVTKSLADVVPADRSTWVCPHDGAWVYARPGYLDIHPECQDVYDCYVATLSSSRMSKRSRPNHSEMAAKMVKQKRATQTYSIIAIDHILDQVTRAIGSGTLSTPGGYISTELVQWDQTDSSQLWTITSA